MLCLEKGNFKVIKKQHTSFCFSLEFEKSVVSESDLLKLF